MLTRWFPAGSVQPHEAAWLDVILYRWARCVYLCVLCSMPHEAAFYQPLSCCARRASDRPLPLLHPCCSREQLGKEYEAMPTKEGAGQQVGGAPGGHLCTGGMCSRQTGRKRTHRRANNSMRRLPVRAALGATQTLLSAATEPAPTAARTLFPG